MQFYFHLNHPTSKLTIHKNNCSYCRNGNGIHSNKRNNNSIWYGPFNDLMTSKKNATKLNKDLNFEIRFCSKCIGEPTKKSTLIPLIKNNLVFNNGGVYKIYLINKNSEIPTTINRLINSDETGLVYIGCSKQKGGIASRLSQFILNIGNQTSNFHTAGSKIANNSALKRFISIYDLYFQFINSDEPKKMEEKLLKKYKNEFGEVPPLNG
jgi:hypothetical protein